MIKATMSDTQASPVRSWLQDFGIALEVIFPALAFIVVILRAYIRIDTKSFGWGKLITTASESPTRNEKLTSIQR